MSIMLQMVGDTRCEWDAEAPLVWSLSRTFEGGSRQETHQFDLTRLIGGYDYELLTHLKVLLVEHGYRVSLASVYTEYMRLRTLLLIMQERGAFTSSISCIDGVFLLALRTLTDAIPQQNLATLKRLYEAHVDSPVFASSLILEDFPIKRSDKGEMGDNIARVLGNFLTRAACVNVLQIAEDAWESGVIDIGHFSFLHLAFQTYLRPSSYCRITLSDLQIDTDPKSGIAVYFLFVYPPKSGVEQPRKIPIALDRMVGQLLEKQRTQIVAIWAPMVAEEDIGKLALFPARRRAQDGLWYSQHARAHHGEPTPGMLRTGYMAPILRLQTALHFNFNTLRHTVGTQLAEAGCSAITIKAILKHASDDTCQAYVDIVYHGLVNQLSDSLSPAFERHFPVFGAFRSALAPIAIEKAIRSEDLETGRSELTGECGRSIACQYAPLACYACPRFIPCYDIDHSINLEVIDKEIARYKDKLPLRHLYERARDIRLHIVLVQAAASQKRIALGQEKMV